MRDGREAIRVLFVCTGNICRSPTAEGVLRSLAEKQNLKIHVESRGTHDYHVGQPPDERAQHHARQRGYDLSAQRARHVAQDDFERFDLIVAMDRGHLRLLQRMAGARFQPKLRLLVPDADVPDPYYGGPDGFERVLDMVEEACRGLLAEIRRTLTSG
jgi:protein-tyrosine phosphatase